MYARMAELVDALDSKSCIRKDVGVRLPFRALFKSSNVSLGFFYLVQLSSPFDRQSSSDATKT